MDEDLIETAIGRFGKYQTWILFLITVGRIPAEYQLNNVVFIIPYVDYKCLDNNVTNYCPCENPEYDTSTIVSSVTTEWNLICNRTYLASLAQSMLQVGILAGSLLYGYFSDRYLICIYLFTLISLVKLILIFFKLFYQYMFSVSDVVENQL